MNFTTTTISLSIMLIIIKVAHTTNVDCSTYDNNPRECEYMPGACKFVYNPKKPRGKNDVGHCHNLDPLPEEWDDDGTSKCEDYKDHIYECEKLQQCMVSRESVMKFNKRSQVNTCVEYNKCRELDGNKNLCNMREGCVCLKKKVIDNVKFKKICHEITQNDVHCQKSSKEIAVVMKGGSKKKKNIKKACKMLDFCAYDKSAKMCLYSGPLARVFTDIEALYAAVKKCLAYDPTGHDCGEDGKMQHWDVSRMTTLYINDQSLNGLFQEFEEFNAPIGQCKCMMNVAHQKTKIINFTLRGRWKRY